MDSPCIKQTVCKVLKIFQYGKYLVAYVLKGIFNNLKFIGLLPNLNFINEVYLPVCEIYIRLSLPYLVHNSLKITEVKTMTHKVT